MSLLNSLIRFGGYEDGGFMRCIVNGCLLPHGKILW